jgi:hypothetical protein
MAPAAQAAVLPLFEGRGQSMRATRRIDQIVDLLESFVLGQIDLSEERMRVALRLLDLATDDDPPPGGGEEVLPLADAPAALVFPSRIAA